NSRQELAVRPGEDGLRSLARMLEEADDTTDPDVIVTRVGRHHDAPGGGRPGPDPLHEPLLIVLDEANRTVDHRPRAPIVRDEVDPPQAGERVVELEDAPHVRQTPAIDRLVVVAHEEDLIGR